MRWSIIALALVIVPAVALAKPTLAVAPLDGDKDGVIADIVADQAAEHGKTTKPERVAREIEKLELSSMSAKSVKKLRIKLVVDVVIHGKLEKAGSKKHLELVLSGPGKAKSAFDVDFRTTKELKKTLAAQLGHHIQAASSGEDRDGDDDDDDDESDKRPSPLRGHNDDDKASTRDHGDGDGDKRNGSRDDQDDDRRASPLRGHDDDSDRRKGSRDDQDDARDKRKGSRDDRNDDSDKRKGSREDDSDKRASSRDRDGDKRTASRDDDDRSIRRRDDDDGDDDGDNGGHRRKKRRHHGEHERHALTQAAAWVDAGAGVARRTLTYVSGGMMRPPSVGTAAPSAQIEGELYPGSFSTLKGPAANIGVAGAFSRDLGLGIAVPGTTIVAPIKSGFSYLGARYRFTFGGSSLAVGASYWRRMYVADRSKLMMPEQLDMPDVNYTAIAPDVTGRFAASPKLGVFASVQLPLMLDSGPIQASTSYGPSTIIAFDVRSGVQYAFGAHYALQVALAFDQIGFKFSAKMGSMAATREVSAATDRSVGLAATLGIMY